jgi:hypothetical protein
MKHVMEKVITITRRLKPFSWRQNQTMLMLFTSRMFVASTQQPQQANCGK